MKIQGLVLEEIYISDIDRNGCLKVPDNILIIGKRAAKNVSKVLKVIDINAVQQIKDFAFCNCKELERVIGFPQVIGREAFSGCEKLNILDFSKVHQISDYAFMSCAFKRVDLNGEDVISKGAFCNCAKLETIIGTPRVIYGYSFNGCVSLREINISNLDAIDTTPFYCSGLSSCVQETEKRICISINGREANFARLNESYFAYRYNYILDDGSDAYIDMQGEPFVIDHEFGDKVPFRMNEELFMKQWKGC